MQKTCAYHKSAFLRNRRPGINNRRIWPSRPLLMVLLSDDVSRVNPGRLVNEEDGELDFWVIQA